MKKEEFFEALNDLDEKDLYDAGQMKKNKTFNWYKPAIALLAVCLLAVLILPRIMRKEDPGHTPVITGPGDDPVVTVPGEIKTVAAEYPAGFGKNMDAQTFLGSSVYQEWWEQWRQSNEQSRRYADSMYAYYRNLLKTVLKAEDENTVCSPLNTYIAFSMLAEVTGGNSRAQLLKMLGAEDPAALREKNETLWRSNYINTPNAASVLANSLWLNNEVRYREDTLRILADHYFASSFIGKPGTEEMDRALRDWTDENTMGLLREYTENMKLDTGTVLDLVSAIYYVCPWTEEFLPEENTEETFRGTASETLVDMMHKSEIMTVYRTDSFMALSLPLQENAFMHVYLPNSGTDVSALAENEDVFRVARFDSEMESRSVSAIVNLGIPKFRVTESMDLKEVLQKMGVTDLFDSSAADFSPLTEEAGEISLSSAKHNAMLEIDEKGVKGAAYTEMILAGGIPNPAETIDFILDRPFMFVITSRDSSILFAGIVRNL